MTDHYDPRTRTLRLSDEVYGGRSVAALVSVTDLQGLEKAEAGEARFYDMMHEAQMRELRFLRDGLREAQHEAAEGPLVEGLLDLERVVEEAQLEDAAHLEVPRVGLVDEPG